MGSGLGGGYYNLDRNTFRLPFQEERSCHEETFSGRRPMHSGAGCWRTEQSGSATAKQD